MNIQMESALSSQATARRVEVGLATLGTQVTVEVDKTMEMTYILQLTDAGLYACPIGKYVGMVVVWSAMSTDHARSIAAAEASEGLGGTDELAHLWASERYSTCEAVASPEKPMFDRRAVKFLLEPFDELYEAGMYEKTNANPKD